MVKRQCLNLKAKNVSEYEKYPNEMIEIRKLLIPHLREANNKNQRAWISCGTLCVDGRSHGQDTA